MQNQALLCGYNVFAFLLSCSVPLSSMTFEAWYSMASAVLVRFSEFPQPWGLYLFGRASDLPFMFVC